MRKRRELALMATPAIATLLSLTLCLEAETYTPITVNTADRGRKIYVNDASVVRFLRAEAHSGSLPRETFPSGRRSGLLEFKRTPVEAGAAPRCACSPVGGAKFDQHLDRPVGFQNSYSLSGFSQKEIDEAVAKATSLHRLYPNLMGGSGTRAALYQQYRQRLRQQRLLTQNSQRVSRRRQRIADFRGERKDTNGILITAT